MAESSIFWTTDGTGDGAASYTASELQSFWARMFQRDTATEGVVQSWANELSVSGTASPVTVATGAGLVVGIPYENTSAFTIAVPTPSTSTRVDRIVLRADYAAQTVRIVRSAGVEGGSAPSLTQSAGVTWEISLAQAAITTGGVITVTDERVFCRYGSGFLRARAGMSATDWNSATSTNQAQIVNKPSMQIGANTFTFSAAASGTSTITFPVAFANDPIVIPVITYSLYPATLLVSNITSTGCDFDWTVISGSNISNIVINWIAIGPMS